MKVPADRLAALAVAWMSSKVLPVAYESGTDRWLAVFALPKKVGEFLPKVLAVVPADGEGVDVEAVAERAAAAFESVPEVKVDFPPITPGRKDGKVLTFTRADAEDFISFVRSSVTA